MVNFIYSKVKIYNLFFYVIFFLSKVKGYIFIEVFNKSVVEEVIRGIRYVKCVLLGEIFFSEIEYFFEEKLVVSGFELGDIVEFIVGFFKGEKVKVVCVDESKDEIVVEFVSFVVLIFVIVRGEYVRFISKC